MQGMLCTVSIFNAKDEYEEYEILANLKFAKGHFNVARVERDDADDEWDPYWPDYYENGYDNYTND